MSDLTSFPCSSCGACCKRVKAISPDWPTREDGACIHLAEDNKCKIYGTRPNICRVGGASDGISLREWFQANADACNRMQVEDGLDEKFRVLIPTESESGKPA